MCAIDVVDGRSHSEFCLGVVEAGVCGVDLDYATRDGDPGGSRGHRESLREVTVFVLGPSGNFPGIRAIS